MSDYTSNSVWLEVAVGSRARGRMDIDLFTEYAPEACEHFRRMCDKSFKASYARTKLHLLQPGLAIFGGSFRTPDGNFFGWGQPITRQAAYIPARGPGYVILTPTANGLGSQFRITLFEEGAATLPSYECVIGRVRNLSHPIVHVLRNLNTIDGGEYQGPPEADVIVVDCGMARS